MCLHLPDPSGWSIQQVNSFSKETVHCMLLLFQDRSVQVKILGWRRPLPAPVIGVRKLEKNGCLVYQKYGQNFDCFCIPSHNRNDNRRHIFSLIRTPLKQDVDILRLQLLKNDVAVIFRMLVDAWDAMLYQSCSCNYVLQLQLCPVSTTQVLWKHSSFCLWFCFITLIRCINSCN